MTFCINPHCQHRQNPEDSDNCQACGTSLWIRDRYRLLHPLRSLDSRQDTELFEIDDRGTRKVMKVLTSNNPQLVEMFEREALTLQSLHHPGIPKVDRDGYFTIDLKHKIGKLHGLVMEKVSGQNLEDWLQKNGCVSQKVALIWLRQLISILEKIHQSAFFHRDIKPSNIMLKPDGQLVLIDFGSVRPISATYLAKVKGGLDLTSIVSGGYTPLEQIEGKAIPQSDFYALGRTFVHLLTGIHPIELPIDPKTGRLIWRNRATRMAQPFAAFIDDLMAPFPADRPQNTSEILRYLTPKGLLVKTILRGLQSPQFKRVSIGLLFLIISGCSLNLFSRPWQFQYYFSRGRQALVESDLDQAQQHLTRATQLDPRDAIAQSDLGLTCKLQKDAECAIERYQRALKLKPDAETAATVRYNLGTLYEDRRQFDRAIVEYEIAMQTSSQIAAVAANNLARLQIWQNQNSAAAIELIQKVLKPTDDPKFSELYKNLGWAYFLQRNDREAERYLRKAIKLDDKNRAAPSCLLAKVLQPSKPSEALTLWENCHSFDAEDLPEVETWQLDALQYTNGLLREQRTGNKEQ